MRTRPLPRSRPRSRLPLAVLSLAAAAGLASTLPAPPARATQEYAKRESRDCSHCHVDPKGGGPRGERGREYEANGHRFGVESWSSPALRDRYLRASAALFATWYREADRELAVLAKEETLPGGTALVAAARERYRMFPRVWLRSAKQLLAKGDRGRANAYGFLAKLESQFPETDEGREAVRLLDEAGKGGAGAQPERGGGSPSPGSPSPGTPAPETPSGGGTTASEDARRARDSEALRVLFLEGRTERSLGNADRAKRIFDDLFARPGGAEYRDAVKALGGG